MFYVLKDNIWFCSYESLFGVDIQLFPSAKSARRMGESGISMSQTFGQLDRRFLWQAKLHGELADRGASTYVLAVRVLLPARIHDSG